MLVCVLMLFKMACGEGFEPFEPEVRPEDEPEVPPVVLDDVANAWPP
jgi:hypothetical protein